MAVRRDNLARIAPRATGQQVYAELHARIVRGLLRPGEALSETRTAEQYGISRTPVREAFWRLGEDGFLRVIPQVGTFVAPINVQSVRDSQFIRETLECRTIRDAAAAATPPAIARLRTQLRQQRRTIAAHDLPTFFAQDEAMHRELMALAGHPFVWQVIAGAKAQLDRLRFLSLEDHAWPGMIVDQHERIVDHLAAHDAEAAATDMRGHLRTAFAAIDRIAAQHPDFFE